MDLFDFHGKKEKILLHLVFLQRVFINWARKKEIIENKEKRLLVKKAYFNQTYVFESSKP